jgi:hypothetical protein
MLRVWMKPGRIPRHAAQRGHGGHLWTFPDERVARPPWAVGTLHMNAVVAGTASGGGSTHAHLAGPARLQP